jgi:hypothetical protein
VGGSTSSGGGGGTSSGSAGGGGGTFSGSAGGAVASPPSPASWMDRLTPCACLRKKKLLDSLHGDRRRWCWGFLGAAVDEVFGWPGFILTRQRTVDHAPRNPCPLRRALGHKKNYVVTRRRVAVHILFKIPNAQLLL